MCTGESGPQCQLSDNEIYGKTSCFESFKFLFLSLLSLSLFLSLSAFDDSSFVERVCVGELTRQFCAQNHKLNGTPMEMALVCGVSPLSPRSSFSPPSV